MTGRARALTALAGAATAAVTLASVVLAGETPDTVWTTYGGVSAAAYAVHVVAGVALIAAGWAAHLLRPTSRIGVLAIATGLAWFAADWIGWTGGPAIVRSVGMFVAPVGVVALAALTASVLPTTGGHRLGRGVIGASAGAIATAAAARLTVYDPLFDLDCWANCTANAFLVRRHTGLSDVLTTTLHAATVVLAPIAAVRAITQWWGSPLAARRATAPTVLPAVAALASTGAVAGLILAGVAEFPTHAAFATLHRLRGIALTLLALGIVAALLDQIRIRRGVAEMAESVDHFVAAGSIERLLRSATGDASLVVAYWVDDPPRLVGSSGTPFAVPDDPALAATTVVRHGAPIGVVVHDRVRVDRTDLESALGPAARLAIDNERLRAASLAQIEELRASRARIVEASDRARRRLERDLHDGAQQRLLAAAYAMRLAAAAARDDRDAETAAFAADAVEQIHVALDDLRAIAHGIHPTVLNESGLDAALRSLALRAEIALEVDRCPAARWSPAVEATAYAMIAEVVDLLAQHRASHAGVEIDLIDAELAVAVRHDGAITSAELADVADRVGAAGGRLAVDHGAITASLPCAS